MFDLCNEKALRLHFDSLSPDKKYIRLSGSDWFACVIITSTECQVKKTLQIDPNISHMYAYIRVDPPPHTHTSPAGYEHEVQIYMCGVPHKTIPALK